MKIAGSYSFKNGEKMIAKRYPKLLDEVSSVIKQVDAPQHKSKISKEKTMPGRQLFSPRSINKSFKAEFAKFDWSPVRVACQYSEEHYSSGYETRLPSRGAFREMDFVKEKLGVEVQFGKYAFMVYNVCAKMTIFHNLGHIDFGIEIVPVKAFAEEMSTGVSYFEKFIWDLEHRGVSDIDIPVLILGIDN